MLSIFKTRCDGIGVLILLLVLQVYCTENDLKNDLIEFPHGKVVTCYLGTWAFWRPGDGSFDLMQHFDPLLCTHLIYSFSGLNNITNRIQPTDPFLDLETDYGKGWYKKATGLKSKFPHLKVLLAIGGWNEGSLKYSKMAASPFSRTAFVDSVIETLQKYDFDGMDMDWEFPSLSSRGGSPEDRQHFTTLLGDLRTAFEEPGYLLTAAFSASPEIADAAYDFAIVANLLDFVHLMAYDYHGSWDSRSGHNSPLRSQLQTQFSIENSVNHFIKKGIPSNKIVLGLPFYGRTFLLTSDVSGNGLDQNTSTTGFQGRFTKEDGFLGYNEICMELKENAKYWKVFKDSITGTPYMRNGEKWVSFDDTESIKLKVDFAVSRNLSGLMIWSIDTDDFRGHCNKGKFPLLTAISRALLSSKPPLSPDVGNRRKSDKSSSVTTKSSVILALSVALTFRLPLT